MSEMRSSGGRARVLLVGRAPDAVPVLQALLRAPVSVVGVAVATAGPGSGGAGDLELQHLVEGRDVPVRRVPDLEVAPALQWMRDQGPNLLVCAGRCELLPATVLTVAPRGVAALHPSLFPRQRRHSPVAWAILRGESTTGSSLLLVAPGPSGGDIVDQRQVAITREDTCATLGEKLARAGAELLVSHLPSMLAGTAPRRLHVPVQRGTLLPERTPDMGITSFDRTTVEVHDWIRGQTRPCPGAYAFLRGRRVTLWAAERMTGQRTLAPPGTVLGVDDGGVVVTTRTGAIKLLEVEGPGNPAEPAADWFGREHLPPGCVFDPVDPQTLAWALGRRTAGEASAGVSPRPGR